ncbi:hypothetical protein Pelo_956 [Pelomyxa schiedti]|nr:hypothetical protein Pelo_956 [Pelomyxa schiedti]
MANPRTVICGVCCVAALVWWRAVLSHPRMFIFLTNWANALAACYFLSSVAADLALGRDYREKRGWLFGFQGAFLRFVTSLNLTVLLMFWGLFFINPLNVMSPRSTYPLTLNVLQHVICPVMLLVECLYHRIPRALLSIITDFVIAVAAAGLYLGYIAWLHYSHGFKWPYRVIEDVGLPTMFFIGCSTIALISLCLRLLPQSKKPKKN